MAVFAHITNSFKTSQKCGRCQAFRKETQLSGDVKDADSTFKYLSSQARSPSPTRLDTYSSEESRESDNSSESTPLPPNVEILYDSDSSSQTSFRSATVPSAEPSQPTVNDVLRRESVTTSQQVHPKNAKHQFYSLLKEHKVTNFKHYDTLLTTSPHLRKIEEMLNPNLLQTCKRKDTYIQRIESFPALDDLRNRDQPTQLEIALITAFLTTISNANNTTIQELCYNLVSVVNQDWHKIRTLLCIGSSDTGKSLLVNLLTNVFEPYEQGVISPPTSNQLSNFWLQDLVGKSVYGCEELKIEFKGVLQRIKQLMEGNKELDTPIKFGDNKALKLKPLVITMNGDHKGDIVGPYHEEFDAVEMLMKTNITSYTHY